VRRLGWALCAVTAVESVAGIALGVGHGLGSLLGFLVTAMSSAIVGALILQRDPGNRIGWILAGAPLFICLSGVCGAYTDSTTGHGALRTTTAWASEWSWMAGLGLPVAFLGLLIPDGRLPSPRWRPVLWFAYAQYAVIVLGQMFAPGVLDKSWGIENPVGVEHADLLIHGGLIAVPPILPAGILACVLRFRRGTSVERQQLKWIVTSLAVAVAFGTLNGLVSNLHPSFHGAPEVIVWLTWATIPIAFGFAILRHRLYEIDVIIRKTLVYTGLVASLGLLYLACIAGLGVAFRSATGQSSAVAVTVSTLLVAAAFQPIRRRIQRAVDRRFYRGAYDAERAVAAFTGRLRRDIDLDALRAELLATVADTVQPAHAAVWLRPAPEEIR
jgi:hypothetical protein